MKSINITTVIILTFLFFSSCTDIIELDLKNTEPRVVIEAVLNISDSTFKVDMTISNEFYETGEFKRITRAEVILKEEGGETYTIPEIEDGIYFLKNIIAEPEDKFYVTVTDADGIIYEANTTAPYHTQISNIIPAPFDPPGGGPGQTDTAEYYQIITLWKDSLGVDNYYRLKTYVNDEFNTNEYLLGDDRINDGDTIAAVTIQELYSGDKFKIELLSTDKKYFNYFMDLAIIQGQGPGGTTPYNPKGNFNNGALGYFGIYSVSEFEIIIPSEF